MRSSCPSDSAGLFASASWRSTAFPESQASSWSRRLGAKFTTAFTASNFSSAAAMSEYARQACNRTQGRRGWPVCASR